MIEEVFEAVFGSILESIPLDISTARRRRLCEKGRRVYLRARVCGVRRTTFIGFVVVERGKLWLAERKGAPEIEFLSLPPPDGPGGVELVGKVRWNQPRYITYAANGRRVQIFGNMADLELLRRALDAA